MSGVATKNFIKVLSAAAVMENVRKQGRQEYARLVYEASV